MRFSKDQYNILLLQFNNSTFEIRSLLDCSLASSFFSFIFFSSFGFSTSSFRFSQEDFGLKPFSFWEKAKEDDEEDKEDEEDEENEEGELKAGDHSSNKLILNEWVKYL